MLIKDLIKKYGYDKIDGFIDISKYPEKDINKKTFDFIKEAQFLLDEVKDNYSKAMKLYRKQGEVIKQGNDTRLLPQWWRLQENYQSCLIRNSLIFE